MEQLGNLHSLLQKLVGGVLLHGSGWRPDFRLYWDNNGTGGRPPATLCASLRTTSVTGQPCLHRRCSRTTAPPRLLRRRQPGNQILPPTSPALPTTNHAEEEMCFIDVGGPSGATVWFNAVADLPPPAHRYKAGSLARLEAGLAHRREREKHWFKAACRMVAVACGAEVADVVLVFATRFEDFRSA